MTTNFIDLNDLYFMQDGILEIEIGLENEKGIREIRVIENDRPHCSTESGKIYIDSDNVIKYLQANKEFMYTDKNKSTVQNMLNSIGNKIDLSNYSIFKKLN